MMTQLPVIVLKLVFTDENLHTFEALSVLKSIMDEDYKDRGEYS